MAYLQRYVQRVSSISILTRATISSPSQAMHQVNSLKPQIFVPLSLSMRRCASTLKRPARLSTQLPTSQQHFCHITEFKYRPKTNGSGTNTIKPPYTIKELPYGTTHPLRVIIIGAGVCGIDMLLSLKMHATNISGAVYEKNAGVGGTCYQYTHSRKPGWSSVFAPAREIEKYLNDVVDKNDLQGYIKCGHCIERAVWDEKSGQWAVTVKDIATGKESIDRAEVLIDATGIFNQWKWPEVEGLHTFKGDLIHTVNWPQSFEYRDKTVAVLGNGASGVQIVPMIQPDVKKLFHLIRSKTWIAPPSAAVKVCREHTRNDSHCSSIKSVEEFNTDPIKYAQFISEIDMLAAKDRFRTITDTGELEAARTRITDYMTLALKSKPALIPMLIPAFPVGCRRITASPSYLDSLTASNVAVSNVPIKRVTTTGIELRNREVIGVDAIICATGFNTSFLPRFPLIGEHGRNLQDEWSEENGGPRAYMSIMVEGMPNYFRFIGPNGPLAHGAIPQLASHISTYVLNHLKKLQTEHLNSIRPLPAAVKDFNAHIRAFMPRTAWAGKNCGGWYRSKVKGGERRVTALHPGSQAHWEQMLRDVRWEDFEMRRKGENRFVYLGNGYTVDEVREKDGGER